MNNKLPSSTASTLKSRQLSHLQTQLSQLQTNLETFNKLITITAQQANDIRTLGVNHTALFMSAHGIFELESQEQEQQQQQQ